jgi:excisionase family DNA binding protein
MPILVRSFLAYSTREAAAFLGVNKGTIRTYVHDGKLVRVFPRAPWFSGAELERFEAARKRKRRKPKPDA